MKKIAHYLSMLLLLLLSSSVLAQLYPVQVVPVLIPPYSSKLVEYTEPTVNRIQLQMITTDLTVVNRPVYLKMYIEGNGIKAQSRELVQGAVPLYINGGDILSLSSVELTPYFRLYNLEGISQNTYAHTLPDGMYSICYEVYDLVTRKRLSQKSCAQMYLMLNDPPFLNLPLDKDKLSQTDFTNIVFSWTPRQINALNVSYTFEIKELRDANLADNYAFDTGFPIHTVSGIRSTTLLYDQSMPTLVAGKKYGWRVKATSFSGLAENSSFKNEGFSEIRSFSIRVNCGTPDLLLPRDNGRQGVRLDWQGAPSHLKYHVQYRKTGIVGAEWFDRYVLNNQTVITDLEPGYTYEFRVGATCEPEVYPASPHYTYSRPQEFTLKASDDRGESGFSCGLKGDTDITNRDPITNLVVNETFYAGDFEVKILGLESTGSTTYSGVGSIYVPYLGITLAVEFKNIEINTDYQLIRGVVETVYDKDWKNVHNSNELTKKEGLHEEVNFIIEKITVDEQGNPKLIGTEGEEKILKKNKDYTVVDKDGKTWTIPSDFDGENPITEPTGVRAESGVPTSKNTKGVDKNGAVTEFSAEEVRIYFDNAEKAKYAFDNASGAKSSSKYGKLYKDVKGEYLPYKAVVNGQQDVVIARVEFKGEPVKLDSLGLDFKTSAGVAIPFKKNSDTAYELTVKGSFNYAEDQIMAVYKPKGEDKHVVAGAMQLIHLSPITLPLKIVPTSSTVNTVELEKAIKAQYSRVGVTVDSKVLALYTGGSLNVSEVSKDDKKALSSYTPSEQKFIEEYFKTHDQEAAFYLFVTDQAGGLKGRMPIQSQFGFVSDRDGDTSLAMTAVHELGHGAFELQHPFTQYSTTPGKSNSTMDIPPATDFNQVDWKQMNMRKFSLKTWVQTKDDGARDNLAHFGLTPNGQVFDNFYILNGTKEEFVKVEVLISTNYVIDAIEYKQNKYKWNANKKAYSLEGNKDIYIFKRDKTHNKKVNLFRSRNDNCEYDYVVIEWTEEDEQSGRTKELIQDRIKGFKASDWKISPLSIRNGNCQFDFIPDALKNSIVNCNSEELEEGVRKLREGLSSKDSKAVVATINLTCLSALRNLSYKELEGLIDVIVIQESLKESSELAILRIMNAIDTKDYALFYKFLEAKQNKIIRRFITEFNDKSIYPWDGNNYTNFTRALITMYNKHLESIEDRFVVSFTDLAKNVVNLTPLTYSTDTSSLLFDKFTLKHNEGVYNKNTGNISLYDVYTSYSYNPFDTRGIGRTEVSRRDLIADVTPLTPLIVVVDKNPLPLIKTALDGYDIKDNQYLVPAFFLKFNADKKSNEDIEKGIITTLDLVTIAGSGGTALATKVHWVRRAWAMAEVAGAVGNIAVNTVKVSPEVKEVVDSYNLAMGIIGMKNVAVGGYKFVQQIPKQTRELIENNKSVRDLLASQYMKWKALTTKASKLSLEEKNLLYEQGEVFKALGLVDDVVRGERIVVRTIDAVSDGDRILERVKVLRQKLTSDFKKSGNFGWAETEIKELSKSEYFAHSSIDELTPTLIERVPDISLKPVKEEFPWSTIPNSTGRLIKRNIDTEYKILTEIAQKLGDNVDVTGKIRLFTERKPCSSCSNVIELFSAKYKKIEIEIIHL
ncbi:deaminase domain-containing protein [Myroides odoratimimus]|uniref:deaminase domain-containing protein n=1 Tax=Myroides odoratimimus TaxID=76832 RepID=UPI0038D3E2E5